LYIGSLILFTFLATLILKKISGELLFKKNKALESTESEYTAFSKETERLETENNSLEKTAKETIGLYNMTKEICKTLDIEKIFTIFKEQVNNHFKVEECQFLSKEADLSLYKGYAIFPLIIDNETIGSLVASGISQSDRVKFGILARQFLIGGKRALLYKKMQELAITDGLTQLFSRRHFLDRFKEELVRSKKFKYKFSFLMVDIDKFKDLNDRYGHLVGDAILREISKAVKETIRQIDFIGRYGGEELSIILVETGKDEARFVAERIRRTIEEKEISAYDERLKVTLSIGISTFSDDGANMEEIIEGADKAMYIAKRSGRNKVRAYEA
jgi:diguanylate cyclase (GGDEF)-like protein